MEVAFGKNAVPATQVAPEPAAPVSRPCCSAVAQRPSGALAPNGLMLGDRIPDFSEIILPRVNIVQNIGALKESFICGSLVLNQEIVLFIPPMVNTKTGVVERAATPPVTITVLGFRPTRYCEKIEGGVRGLIVNSEAEVRAAGGTLDYQEWKLKKESGMKRFEPLADALVLIEAPEGEAGKNPLFSYEIAGKNHALAMWGMRGTSYTAAAKRVFFTARAVGNLRQGGYPSWSYAVSSREEQYPGGNRAWIPICLPKAKTPPEFLAFVQQVLNAPPAAPEDAAASPAPVCPPGTVCEPGQPCVPANGTAATPAGAPMPATS